MHSPFNEAKNDSATALSQHCPVRPTDSRSRSRSARLGVLPGRVLTAAVGVEDHPRVGVAAGDGVAQRVGDQVGAQVVGDRPADDPARAQVDDGGQVQPALPGVDVGDVAAPAGVDLGRRRRRSRGGPGPAAPSRPGRARWSCATVSASVPRSPAARISRATRLRRDPVAAALQGGVDARGAVAALRLGVDVGDLLGQLRVGRAPARTGWPSRCW